MSIQTLSVQSMSIQSVSKQAMPMQAMPKQSTPVEGMSAAPARSSAGLRLTTRGKRVIALLGFVPALIGIGAIAAQPAIAAVSEGAATASLETVTVQSGQTLWEVAETITVDRDVRDVVADLQRLNGLEGGHVEPGQTLLLPRDR